MMSRLDADDEGQWITTENGHKVHLNEAGDPDMGNRHVVEKMRGGKKSQVNKAMVPKSAHISPKDRHKTVLSLNQDQIDGIIKKLGERYKAGKITKDQALNLIKQPMFKLESVIDVYDGDKSDPVGDVSQLRNALGNDDFDKFGKALEATPEPFQKLFKNIVGYVPVSRTADHDAWNSDKFELSLGKDAVSGNKLHLPNEIVFHEYGHAIQYILGQKTGYGENFAEKWNNGEFLATLSGEADAFFEENAKNLSKIYGRKLTKASAMKELSFHMGMKNMADKSGQYALEYSAIADILDGTVKGQFSPPWGHSKRYWTGWKTQTPVSVANEAFAHMCGSLANMDSARTQRIKEVFPNSYNCFLRMIEECADL